MFSSTSAARSVGNVSPGNRVSFRIPARDSAIALHTSSLLRPMEQMIPPPVTPMRTFGSGLRKVETAPAALQSVAGAGSGEAIGSGALRVERHRERDDVARSHCAIDRAVII